METGRKYVFDWSMLGDLEGGCPNPGCKTCIEAYRLMQYTFRDVIEREFGHEKTDWVFFDAGKMAGSEFYRHLIGDMPDLPTFVSTLQKVLKEMEIGILRVEDADTKTGKFIMPVSEDLDCSGLPETGYGVCTYDEGFVAGLVEQFTGVPYDVVDIDCWCTGDRTCRFTVDPAASS